MASGKMLHVAAIRGTGADLEVQKIGFRPSYVRIVNVTDPVTLEHFEGMGDASGFKHIDATQSFITTLGITLTEDGFTLGADTDVNVDGEALWIVAWR